MYRYQPPKASIWGHGLGKMPAGRARALLRQFLGAAAKDWHFSGGALSFTSGASEYVAEFESMLGMSSQHSAFHNLTEEQCERCVDAIVADENGEGRQARSCILIQPFTIARWQLPGQVAETPSEVSMFYGQGAYLSTSLQFATVEDFRSIRSILEELGLCKLNEKHLKEVKQRKAGRHPTGG